MSQLTEHLTNQRDNLLFLLAQGTKLAGRCVCRSRSQRDNLQHAVRVYRARLDLVTAYTHTYTHRGEECEDMQHAARVYRARLDLVTAYIYVNRQG